jgi:hypothetical protein
MGGEILHAVALLSRIEANAFRKQPGAAIVAKAAEIRTALLSRELTR